MRELSGGNILKRKRDGEGEERWRRGREMAKGKSVSVRPFLPGAEVIRVKETRLNRPLF